VTPFCPLAYIGGREKPFSAPLGPGVFTLLVSRVFPHCAFAALSRRVCDSHGYVLLIISGERGVRAYVPEWGTDAAESAFGHGKAGVSRAHQKTTNPVGSSRRRVPGYPLGSPHPGYHDACLFRAPP
jgi:hypothetical protein